MVIRDVDDDDLDSRVDAVFVYCEQFPQCLPSSIEQLRVPADEKNDVMIFTITLASLMASVSAQVGVVDVMDMCAVSLGGGAELHI